MSTSIALRFLVGRYHATPWDRQVNEAEVEWPPSPWRLLRALIAVWHRKVSPSGDGEEVLESLVQYLAGSLPHYRLPRATTAHSRHFMPEGRYISGVPSKNRTLVFDAWAAIDRDEELVVVWPDVELPEAEQALLAELLAGLGYLGRAEGWVEARVLDAADEAAFTSLDDDHRASAANPWDCLPAALAGEGALERGEMIRLPVPLSAESYERWRAEQIQEQALDAKRLKMPARRLLQTLPPSLLDVLRLETADVRNSGWSVPPGVRFEAYCRRSDAFDPHGFSHRSSESRSWGASGRGLEQSTTVRLSIGGRPRPRIVDAIRVGEVMRVALISNTDRRSFTVSPAGNEPGQTAHRSPEVVEALALLSGHDLPPDSERTFYLPEDADGDGLIDHILVHIPQGIPPAALKGFGRIREIWREADERWPTLVEAVGTRDNFPSHPYLTPSRVWTSVTPYLHPWHRKKRFTVEDQIRKECVLRGWGEPNIEAVDAVSVAGKPLRPIHFHRFRSRRGLTQPDRSGSFWRLTFPEVIEGPVTLGFGRFYGLGLFRRDK